MHETSNEIRVNPERLLEIEAASNEGAFGHNALPEPSEAQIRAGNYKKGRFSLFGLPIAIEQPRGAYRTGIGADGKRWATRLASHYGYFVGTKGCDGDPVDVFVGPFIGSQTAYVVNQVIGGRFDEHKVLIGFVDEADARRAYLDSYERGWNGLASVVSLSVSQLKWWLKNGDMRRPLRAENLPHEGLETMTRKVQWNSEALPYDQTLDQVLYEIRRSDAGESLLLDAVSAQDIIEDADGALAFDALVTPYAKLERKMEVLQGVMVRSGESVKPVAMQVTEPFKQRGVANVAAIFELSDGQTVSIFFHNPDVTPNKMAASDEVISWKWLLNKKDITIVVAPERGEDLNVREVARRIIRLAEKNSPAFQRANTKRAERMQGIQALKDEITALEAELATAQHELEVAKVSAEDRAARSGAMIAWKTPLAELGGAEVTAPKYKEGDAVSFNLEPLGSPFFKPEKTTSGTIAKIRTYETESKGAMGGEFKKISYAYDILKTDGKTQDAVEEDYILGSTEGAKVEIPTVDVQNEAKTGGAIEQAPSAEGLPAGVRPEAGAKARQEWDKYIAGDPADPSPSKSANILLAYWNAVGSLYGGAGVMPDQVGQLVRYIADTLANGAMNDMSFAGAVGRISRIALQLAERADADAPTDVTIRARSWASLCQCCAVAQEGDGSAVRPGRAVSLFRDDESSGVAVHVA